MAATLGVAGLVLAASVGSGSAQDASREQVRCDCLASLEGLQEGEAVGSVTQANGRVDILGAGGWASAPVGTPLAVGDVLETGKDSGASITIRNCEFELYSQTKITLRPTDGLLCVAIGPTGPQFSAGAIVAAGAAIGLGTAVIIAVGDDSPYSP